MLVIPIYWRAGRKRP